MCRESPVMEQIIWVSFFKIFNVFFAPQYFNNVKMIRVVMKQSWLYFNCQSLPAFISHLFTT